MIITLSVYAQADEENPNESLGLTDKYVDMLCTAAQGKISEFYDWQVGAVFELILRIEKKPFPDFESNKVANEFIMQKWNTKYSKCYCEMPELNLRGSLDMISVYSEKDDWVWALYDSNGSFGAEINKIRYLNFQLGMRGTLLDYLDFKLNPETGDYKVKSSDFKAKLEYIRERTIKMGGKRMSEMTAEEIEQNSK
ncbi:MAG: hypothetical protein RIC80_13985 [Cyclobacteriaceae bacterium]